MSASVEIHKFFHETSCSFTYVVWDKSSRDAVVIDPVLHFEPALAQLDYNSLEPVRTFVENAGLRVHWILETHVHADHLTGARGLRECWPGARIGMGMGVTQVFETFKTLFAWPKELRLAAVGADRLFSNQEEVTAGNLRFSVRTLPGHTPACLVYQIGDALFTGDALMMPDAGVGRCDFAGGSAGALYDSVWGKLYALPDQLRVFVGHDYQPGGRALREQTTLGEQKRSNVHIQLSTSRADFIAFREARDKTLSPPKLLNVSLDWNLGAFQLVKPLN